MIGRLKDTVHVAVDGEAVAEAREGERGEWILPLRAAETEFPVAHVRIMAGSWRPADLGESDDDRLLSVMLREIAVEPLEDADPTQVRAYGTESKAGKGWVIQGANGGANSTVTALSQLILAPETFRLPPLPPELASDGCLDLVYLTVTEDELLFYNHGSEPRVKPSPQGQIKIPPHSIVSVPR